MLSPNAPSFLPVWAVPLSCRADVHSSSQMATSLWTWMCSSAFLITFPVLFFSLFCWWYKWRKCLSPAGHWGPARHKLLSPCKGLLRWHGFCLFYLSQMLQLSLTLHLKSFVRSWPRAFGNCKPEAKRIWTAECCHARWCQPTTKALSNDSCHREANRKNDSHYPLPWPPAFCHSGAMRAVVALCGSSGCWASDFSALTKWDLAISYRDLCQVCHMHHILQFRRHTRPHS